jgi:hypothetical protein
MPHFVAIHGIGIELEGGDWPDGRDTEGWKEDGSVDVEGSGGGEDCDCPNSHDVGYYGHHDDCASGGYSDSGEVASPILMNWREVKEFVTDCYPKNIDSSCGMHVHASFKEHDDYVRVMRQSFYKLFQKNWNAWARSAELRGFPIGQDVRRLRSRLQGGNTYCQDEFFPERTYLASHGGGHTRYTQLNYRWKAIGTLECRVLPMFDTAERALSAVGNLIKMYNTYLKESSRIEYVLNTINMDEKDFTDLVNEEASVNIEVSRLFTYKIEEELSL